MNRLAAELDARRTPPASLASAIRLYVLERVTNLSQSEQKGPGVKP